MVIFLLGSKTYSQSNIVKNGNFQELKYDFLAGIKCIDNSFRTLVDWDAIVLIRVEAWQAKFDFNKIKVQDDRDTKMFVESSANVDSNQVMIGLVVGSSKYSTFAREYLMGKLAYPLQKGKSYKFSMQLYLPDFFCVGVDSFGFKVSKDKHELDYHLSRTDYTAQMYLPQIFNQWLTIETEIIATGEEEFITIGNFQQETKQLAPNQKKEKPCLDDKQAQYFIISNISLTALDSSEWPLAEVKVDKPIVGASTEKPAPQVFNKKYNLVFMSNSADLPPNMGEIEAAAQKLRRENVAFTLHIDSPKNYTSYAKTLVEERQNKLTAFFDSLEATNIKYSSPLKMLLQRSQEINIRIEYSHDANLLRDY